MALQGLASFPGISLIIGAEFTLSHGISPSVGTIRTVPHSRFIAQTGDLVFTFGNERITFKDCALDLASLEVNENGQEWTLNFLDRRWRWKNDNGGGYISGHWNRRLPNGSIDPDYQKTPQELAKLIFAAMGETRFSLADLPNKPRPEVFWDYTNPAHALANLCDSLACRIVLGIDDKVYLRQIGKGKQLPNDGRVASGGFGFDTSVVPSSLLVVGGPLRYETKFLLEAVGLETDGSVKVIDKLSYKPAAGWGKVDRDTMAGVTATYKKDGETLYAIELAVQSVWRWYRIKTATGRPSGELQPIGMRDKITDLADILPLGPGLIAEETDPDGTKRPKPYEVSGQWYGFRADASAITRGDVYRGPYSVDAQNGIVKFGNPVFKISPVSDPIAAELYLRTSHGVKVDGLPLRFERERKIPKAKKAKTKARILRHDEIDHTQIHTYNHIDAPGKPTDNLADVNKEADHWLDAALREYAIEPSVSFEYAGLVRIQPDGAIQQVSWRVGNNQPAVTRASRNQENDIYVPSWKERRRIEKQEELREFTERAGKAISKAFATVKKFFGAGA